VVILGAPRYLLKYLSTFGSAQDLDAARLVLRSCTHLLAPVICTLA